MTPNIEEANFVWTQWLNLEYMREMKSIPTPAFMPLDTSPNYNFLRFSRPPITKTRYMNEVEAAKIPAISQSRSY